MPKPNRLFGLRLAFGLAVLLTGVSLHAQTSSTSTVTGTIYDKSGATVPNAKVGLEDVDTKAKNTTISGSDGGSIFPPLCPRNPNRPASHKDPPQPQLVSA